MNISSPKTSFSLFTVICTTFGHDYIVTRKVTDHINEYKCTHCGREVTNNYNGKVELLTHKIKQVNTNLATFIRKKRNRVPINKLSA